MMVSLLFLIAVGAEPSSSRLEFEGSKGVEFFGVCFSKETGEQRKIEGVAPAKITLDVNVQKCSIQKKSSKGVLKIRLFQNQKLVTDKSLSGPMSGVELVIPFF